jgi:hypothetical protein
MRFAMVLTKGVFVGCLSAGALIVGACADGNTTPTSPTASAAAAGLAPATPGTQTTPGQAASLSARSGALHVKKECSSPGFTGQAGDYCTITESNVKAIEVGSRVVYAKAGGADSLDSDVVLDLPGNGNNTAFGHCKLVFATSSGLCTFEGGTGKFTHLWVRAQVSYLGGVNWAWDGDYSLGPQD